MRLKSYFADTIEEAISQARREMGPEAMLVNSKRSQGGSAATGRLRGGGLRGETSKRGRATGD